MKKLPKTFPDGTVTGLPRRISEVPTQVWILLGLIALIFAIYGQTAWHPFVNLDDEALIYGNPHVRNGLTWENILWAFTSTSGASFWHPLTWLSHMLDVELFGMNAGGHHLMSAGIHALNAMLLFLVLVRMTGSMWRSAFVAALFAVHPLHVESVAWAAERKDVLSTLFFLLSLWAYARYAERPDTWRYIGVVLFFGMSLMSKPMAVTLPFVLLLLDYWPLGRIERTPHEGARGERTCAQVPWGRILWEKVPLLLMTAGSVAVTLSYEAGNPWIVSLENYPLWIRVGNAVVAYATYLWMTVWPASLAVFYPHPGRGIALWKIAAGGLFLAGATLFVVRVRRRRPYLPVGWFFFLGTLVPAIGLVQIGSQAMADRFTYVPLIGVFVAFAWTASVSWERRGGHSSLAAILAVSILLVLTLTARHQVTYWKDNQTLYEHALAVTSDNWLIQNNLGVELKRQSRYDDAIDHFLKAIRIRSDAALAYEGLAESLTAKGRFDQAKPFFLEAIRLNPANASLRISLGNALYARRNLDEAAIQYKEALRIRANDFISSYNLANVVAEQGRLEEAAILYRDALRIRPDSAHAHNDLGDVLHRMGRRDEALFHFRQALRYMPDDPVARKNIEKALQSGAK